MSKTYTTHIDLYTISTSSKKIWEKGGHKRLYISVAVDKSGHTYIDHSKAVAGILEATLDWYIDLHTMTVYHREIPRKAESEGNRIKTYITERMSDIVAAVTDTPKTVEAIPYHERMSESDAEDMGDICRWWDSKAASEAPEAIAEAPEAIAEAPEADLHITRTQETFFEKISSKPFSENTFFFDTTTLDEPVQKIVQKKIKKFTVKEAMTYIKAAERVCDNFSGHFTPYLAVWSDGYTKDMTTLEDVCDHVYERCVCNDEMFDADDNRNFRRYLTKELKDVTRYAPTQENF